ncbi:MAG: hypothetical protein KC609_04705, partial [Myxococcales bacterium]|nr:hypothetical protein [Myxococcales bacterium]
MLEWLLGPIGEYSKLTLVSLSELPLWVLLGCGLVAVVVVGITLWGYSRDTRKGSVALLVFLRLAVVAIVIAMVLQPAFLKEIVVSSKNHLVILIDDSQSMT